MNTDTTHLLLNLIGVVEVAILEYEVGSHLAFLLFLGALVGVTTLDLIFTPTKCAVGISSILIAILTWGTLYRYTHHRLLALLLLTLFFIPHSQGSKVDGIGHLYGLVIGALMLGAYGALTPANDTPHLSELNEIKVLSKDFIQSVQQTCNPGSI